MTLIAFNAENMTSSVCDINEYVCTLDENSLKKAKEELNEDPTNRMGAVRTFREWIVKQPHVKCPTDTAFLLLFLRVRYFSQLEARKLLEEFLIRRTKLSKWFKNLDPAESKMLDIIGDGSIIILPDRDDEGRKIMIVRPGLFYASTLRGHTATDVFRMCACLYDWMYLTDEKTCINGTVTILDAVGYTLHVHAAVPLEDRRDFIQTWQGAYPARIKSVHLYNAGAIVDLAFSIIKLCMTEKIQKRVKNHGQTLENIYKEIPMRCLPVEYLPDDYTGPNAGTERQIIDDMKREITKPEVRERMKYLSSDQFGIDESKRPKKDVPQASFRKLNID